MNNLEQETLNQVKRASHLLADKINDSYDIDWEKRRYEIAKECLAAEMANPNHDYGDKASNVRDAVIYADLLIAALRKSKDSNEDK